MTKAKTTNLMILSLVGLTFAASSAWAVPQSYPLKCRGANTRDLLFTITPSDIQMTFKKAPQNAVLGLQPGQCAWMDRALNANEPARIAYESFDGHSRNQTSILYYGDKTVAGFMAGPSGAPEAFTNALTDPSKYWIFQVYNEGSDLRVTASAPVAN